MTTSSGSGKPGKAGKLTRADRKAARTAKRAQRRETFRNVGQAFTLTRQADPRFLPYLIGSAVLAAAVGYVVVFLITGSAVVPIVFAVLLGLMVGMFVFSRRAQRSMFAQAEGQAGAAGWLLKQQLRGDWRLTEAVAGTTQLDAVHRLVGRPGVVLVGEGAPHRVRGLIAQEKKRTARVVGDTPIYDITIGTGEGDIRLAKLNRYLLKLPANLSKEQVGALEKRLAALGGSRALGLPKGPMPQGAKMRNVQRTVRRRT
jgi:F0F1-type ATP synthase assembly protein I